MRCPKCGCQEDKVIDSRASREGATIRRRRECAKCDHRFTTYEEVEREGLMVLNAMAGMRNSHAKNFCPASKKPARSVPSAPKPWKIW